MPGFEEKRQVELLGTMLWMTSSAALSTLLIFQPPKNSQVCLGDGKQPDGLSMTRWESGKPVVWDATVVYTLADSYTGTAAGESGSAAKCTDQKKVVEYI